MSTPEGFYFFNQFCSDKKLLADIATYAATLPWHEAPCQYCKIYEGRKRCNGAENGDVWRLYLETRGDEWQKFFARLPKFPAPFENFEVWRTQLVKYSPHAELKPHRDCRSFGSIAFLTVAGEALFTIQPSLENSMGKAEITTSRGDLVIVSGEAYWNWVHSVKNFETDRLIWLMGDRKNNIVDVLAKQAADGLEFLRRQGITIG
jgi:alkylated DNA repair dioxygenase AlkB